MGKGEATDLESGYLFSVVVTHIRLRPRVGIFSALRLSFGRSAYLDFRWRLTSNLAVPTDLSPCHP